MVRAPPDERDVDTNSFGTVSESGVEVPLAPVDVAHYWYKQGETRFVDRHGNTVPVSQIIQAHYDENGEVAYFSTIARDLRPYREAEQRLRTLFSALDQAADMVWITDREGRVEYANAAFEEVTGYSREEAQGQKVAHLLKSGYHNTAFYERLWATLNAGEAFRDSALSLDFRVDEETEQVIITVRDSNTDEVIRQIPPEAMLQVAKRMEEMSGLLIEEWG